MPISQRRSRGCLRLIVIKPSNKSRTNFDASDISGTVMMFIFILLRKLYCPSVQNFELELHLQSKDAFLKAAAPNLGWPKPQGDV
jgi:hypothetical protein